MKHGPHNARQHEVTAKRAEDTRQSNRLQEIIAIIISGLILIGLGFLGYALYEQFVAHSETMGQEAPTEEFVPLTHDELLGRPLSFETPAFIRIPAIDLKEEVREGSDDEDAMYQILAMGPTHLTHTGYPGWDGNCVISGRKTTMTKPFSRLDELGAGDSIFIDNPRGTYEYVVQEIFYADPAKNVTLQTPDPILTLTTYAPERDAKERLIVRGALSNYIPIEETQ
jgi:LPXTG-site transpeptidase (sortase) family protein